MTAKRTKGRPPKKVDPEKVIQRAVQLATGEVGIDFDGRDDLVQAKELKDDMNKFLKARTGMVTKEFYERVTGKLEGLVELLAEDLGERYKDMPPQNLAYALGVLIDKVNVLKGRPQALTANLSMGFGAKERSREEILDILNGSKVVTEESNDD
tara:strand:+ start:556 stop:1017 length:462 start_codon:yes stop_codon:yes gene_type:complete